MAYVLNPTKDIYDAASSLYFQTCTVGQIKYHVAATKSVWVGCREIPQFNWRCWWRSAMPVYSIFRLKSLFQSQMEGILRDYEGFILVLSHHFSKILSRAHCGCASIFMKRNK
jgi:hypothetical protein